MASSSSRLCPYPGRQLRRYAHADQFGAAGCFSLQTWKQINAGEGGIIVTDDEDLAARAILASGACSTPSTARRLGRRDSALGAPHAELLHAAERVGRRHRAAAIGKP